MPYLTNKGADVYKIGRVQIEAERVPGIDYHIVTSINTPWDKSSEWIQRVADGFMKTGLFELWTVDGIVYYKVSKKMGKYFKHNDGGGFWVPPPPQQGELFDV